MIYQIHNIICVEPYKITCVWNTGETRIVDLETKLKEWGAAEKSVFRKLLDATQFKKVKCDGTTVFWDGLATMTELDGSKHPAPLDLDPYVLFENSKLIS